MGTLKRIVEVTISLPGMGAFPGPAYAQTLQHFQACMDAGQWMTLVFGGSGCLSPTRLIGIQYAHHEQAGCIWRWLSGCQ